MKLHLVPARTGLQWVRLGLQLFARQPMVLTSIFTLAFLGLSLLASLPLLGAAAAGVLMPAATVGLMQAARLVQRGQRPLPACLKTAFTQGREQTRAMLAMGAAYAAAMLLLGGIEALLGPTQLQQMLAQHGGRFTPDLLQNPQLSAALQENLWRMALMAMLYLPVSMLFWHAPALLHWHRVPLGKALFFSMVGMLKNTGAYLLFGLGWALVFLGSYLLVGGIAFALGSPTLALFAMTLLGLLLMAATAASMWLTFEGTFNTGGQAGQD